MNWDKNYRIHLVTKDGCLILNRGTNKDLWTSWDGWVCDKDIRKMLSYDLREKGVRLLSYTMHQDRLEGIVEWL